MGEKKKRVDISTDISVLQITNSLGGAERSAVELSCALQNKGYKINFIVDREGPLCEYAANHELHVIPIPIQLIQRLSLADFSPAVLVDTFGKTVSAIRWIRNLVRNTRLLYANGDHAMVYAALSAVTVPMIFHSRDVRRDNRILSLAAHRASAVICVSQFVANYWLKTGLPDSRVHVVHNGVDTEYYGNLPDKEEARETLGLPKTAKVVLWSGNIVPWKRPLSFIDAALELNREMIFVLVGGTHFAQDIPYEKMVKERASQAGVKVFPFVEDLRPFYAAADMVVSTSIDEPFGRVLVESMAAGRPVISTASGGKTEIIEDGKTGILVPPDDADAFAGAIKQLANNIEFARKIGNRAQKTVNERFDISICANHVAGIIDKILQNNS